ncbi:MAG: hypothetical protein V8Q86_09950 [Blautia sp.]
MKKLYSLFLAQAYQDCWDDYNRALKNSSFPKWDYVFLTASNNQQTEIFCRQIEERQNFLPGETKFVAIPDRDGKRVGSGGATLEVLISKRTGRRLLWPSSTRDPFRWRQQACTAVFCVGKTVFTCTA